MANVKIEERLIVTPSKSRPGTVSQKKWIIIHETGNYDKGAGADNHASYLANLAKQNDTYLSWHYTVDDKKIIRHVPDNEVTWNAGDGTAKDSGNYTGISIEICVNPDSDFSAAMDNAASLVADLLKKYKLSVSAVKQHNFFSRNNKNCPKTMREQGLWNGFLEAVQKHLNKTSEPVTAPKGTEFAVGDKVILNGNVYVDSFASKAGQKFSYKVATVTKVVDKSRPAPYLLDNGLGWAKGNDLSDADNKSKELKVGARVNVNGNLYTTSYGEKPVRAISGNFVVSRVIKGRVAGVLLNNNLGWVREQDVRVI